jgi:hypothetical protein
VSDELAAIDNETRERGPERPVGEEIWEAALLLEDELVEDKSKDKVEGKADEEEDENDCCKGLTTTSSSIVLDLCATASRGIEVESIGTVLGLIVVHKVGRGSSGLAEDVDLGRTLHIISAAVAISVRVSEHGRLANLGRLVVRGSDLLSAERATREIVPIGSAEAGGSIGGPASGAGNTAEVKVHHVAVKALEQVVRARCSVVIEGSKVIAESLAVAGIGNVRLALKRLVLRENRNSHSGKNNKRKHLHLGFPLLEEKEEEKEEEKKIKKGRKKN